MRIRIALAMTFVTTILLFTLPVQAAPVAQTTIEDFTLNAQTTLAVTIAITGGQVIVVPIDLTLIARNENGTPNISIIAQAEQQAGMFIGIANSTDTNVSLQSGLVDPIAAATATAVPSADSGSNREGTNTGGANTYVVNANANLRAGPGTNFEIIGKPRFGDIVVVAGQNEDGTWMQLDNGGWIAAFLLDPTEDDQDDNPDNEENTEAVPAPTPVPTESPAAAENRAALAAYLQQVTEISTEISDGVAILRALLQNPQPFTDQWRGQVSTQLTLMTEATGQYAALTSQPGYEDLGLQVLGVATICEQATDYLASGLEDPRSFSPTLASDLLQSCALQATNLADDAQALP